MHENYHISSSWKNEDGLLNLDEKLSVGKRLFLFITLLNIIFVALITFGVWYLISPRLESIHPYLHRTVFYIFLFIIFFIILEFFTVIITIILKKDFLRLLKKNIFVSRWILPLALRTGQSLGISRDKIAHSFVKVNNSLVRAIRKTLNPPRLVVLIPRCIQYSECPNNLLESIENCKDCGKCVCGKLKELSQKYDVEIFLATGGNMAREIIRDIRPTAVIAVACERELACGIQDTASIPVLAIPNERPEGPCKNTTINIEILENAIRFYLNGETLRSA